jgi:tight adherence protein C
MSIFSLSLIFLSPIIALATYILIEENSDPLHGFHDKFQAKKLQVNSSGASRLGLDNNYSDPETINRIKLVSLIFMLAIGLLFLIGSSFKTIFFLVLILIVYRYWERGNPIRLEKRSVKLAEEEFPAIVELFAVLVSAGESPSNAMLRVSERVSGEMGKKFKGTIVELRNGSNLTQSLEVLESQVDSAMIRRFCDTLILAMERGTSLSEVLIRQVEEVRAAHHAALLTAAGKAEISLMIPVIFLILPISVLFALWPSYVSLGQSIMG